MNYTNLFEWGMTFVHFLEVGAGGRKNFTMLLPCKNSNWVPSCVTDLRSQTTLTIETIYKLHVKRFHRVAFSFIHDGSPFLRSYTHTNAATFWIFSKSAPHKIHKNLFFLERFVSSNYYAMETKHDDLYRFVWNSYWHNICNSNQIIWHLNIQVLIQM